jgi:hypothetical protein
MSSRSRRKSDVEPVEAGHRPGTARQLHHTIREELGISIATVSVCRGHNAPWEFFRDIFLDPPGLALIHGPRGGGKSFLSALDTHLRSRWSPGLATRILGGSRAQSMQVYLALRELAGTRAESAQFERLLCDGARYRNGSEVKILAASSTSVRGPHVPCLKLDEVDEIDPELREAAMGMCMNLKGEPASVVMTSTWHRVGGPMSGLVERARGGELPYYSFCVFEVLERCPEERSGPGLERCGECPLMPWCHEDRADDPAGRPKAKRSSGHYGIDALIQKLRGTSRRTFEADYLCRGPRADGLWFPEFRVERVADASLVYDPGTAVHLAVDPGVFTGAVLFQVVRGGKADRQGVGDRVHVLGDYLAENLSAEQNARALAELAGRLCGGRLDAVWVDPAGGARTSIGPTVLGEYERAGLRSMKAWPRGSVADSLALLESFLQPADAVDRLRIHPRCKALLNALAHYRRARRGGQWQDYPEDPQHPHEDLVDALRGGLRAIFPEGRRTADPLPRIPARQVF